MSKMRLGRGNQSYRILNDLNVQKRKAMSEASFIYFRGVLGGSSHDLGYVVNKHGDRCKSPKDVGCGTPSKWPSSLHG